MKSVFIVLLITCCFATLLMIVFRGKKYGKHALYLGKKPKSIKKKKKIRASFDKSKLMGPDNPMWAKMYAEEMAKRNTAQTTAVVKKWLREE